MPSPSLLALAAAACAAALSAAAPARGADMPASPPVPPSAGAPAAEGWTAGGGGFRVARIPVRTAPRRFDVYGYPLLPGAPDPLAAGHGCPPALQPDYDADGNLAGYAPIPMCR